MTNTLRTLFALGILVCHINAQGLPFPCTASEEPCRDFEDPSGASDPCSNPAEAICHSVIFLVNCPVTCLTCAPCLEPEPIPGFDAIVQSVSTTDTQVVVQILTSEPFVGASFQTICTLESGEEAFVETLSGGGGVVAKGAGFSMSSAAQGRWTVSPLGSFNSVAPGFFSLIVLETESLAAKGCKAQSVTLQDGRLFHPEDKPISFCGSRDIPCPARDTALEPFHSLCGGRKLVDMDALRTSRFDAVSFLLETSLPLDTPLCILGTSDADTITGGLGDDVILGFQGKDEINGLSGDDTIYGGTGRDTIDGGQGANAIYDEQDADGIAVAN